MQTQTFTKKLLRAKLIQVSVWVLLEIAFVIILVCVPTIGKYMFDDSTIFVLCCFAWIFSLLGIIGFIYDFTQIRSLALQSHSLQREAYLDSMTGIPNRHGLDTILRSITDENSLSNMGCYIVTISNLKDINNALGREVGDNLILDFASIFETVGDNYGSVGRNGGNEFLIVIHNCYEDTIRSLDADLTKELHRYNTLHNNAPIEVQSAFVLNSNEHLETFSHILALTYERLHSNP